MKFKFYLQLLISIFTPKNKYIRRVLVNVFLILLFLALDAFIHRQDYTNLKYCVDTFNEPCKLIAVPNSVADLVSSKE